MSTTIKAGITATAVGLGLLSTAVVAAVPAKIQNAANKETASITRAANADAQIPCNQAAMRVAKAAKTAATGLKGAELHANIRNAVQAAAAKYKISSCITPVMASNAASAVTGIQGAMAPVAGLGKAGLGTAGALGAAGAGAAGAAGAGAAAAGFGGLGLLGATAAAVATVAVVKEATDDDDCASGDSDCD
ncbi:MAG: hypothetical protein CSB47_08705 [Proteobacteria bacterium]|nr:MAG: hypothetical protein CSB47_08705 [Pseudomonadota bacterium]